MKSYYAVTDHKCLFNESNILRSALIFMLTLIASLSP